MTAETTQNVGSVLERGKRPGIDGQDGVEVLESAGQIDVHAGSPAGQPGHLVGRFQLHRLIEFPLGARLVAGHFKDPGSPVAGASLGTARLDRPVEVFERGSVIAQPLRGDGALEVRLGMAGCECGRAVQGRAGFLELAHAQRQQPAVVITPRRVGLEGDGGVVTGDGGRVVAHHFDRGAQCRVRPEVRGIELDGLREQFAGRLETALHEGLRTGQIVIAPRLQWYLLAARGEALGFLGMAQSPVQFGPLFPDGPRRLVARDPLGQRVELQRAAQEFVLPLS